MKRTEAIEWLKNIKEKYIHGGDDFYDYQRRTAIDYAMSVLENIKQKPMTNADRIRAMSDEELAQALYNGLDAEYCTNDPVCADLFDSDDGIPEEKCIACALRWLRQPLKENNHA